MRSVVTYQLISAEVAGQRLDNYLMTLCKGVPKSHIYRIIRSGEVRVNKKRAAVSLKLLAGDTVRIPPMDIPDRTKPVFVNHVLNQLKASIIFEDTMCLVINKPSGIAVHGGSGVDFGVIEGLRHIRQDLSYLELVHRLDRETSGCLLLAKKRSFLRKVHQLFADQAIRKSYWTILKGPWKSKKSVVTVEVPLRKNILRSGERMVFVDDEGKPSKTVFHLKENYAHACLVEAELHTGRTHQIRVHSGWLGHPVVGDTKYDKLSSEFEKESGIPISRLYLHAHTIRFWLDDREYHFTADLDEAFLHMLKTLRKTQDVSL